MRRIGVVHELPVRNEMDSGYHATLKSAGERHGKVKTLIVEMSRKENLENPRKERCGQIRFRGKAGARRIPPAPYPSKTLDWRGFTKMICKILSV
jgi:hypothetical protein